MPDKVILFKMIEFKRKRKRFLRKPIDEDTEFLFTEYLLKWASA